MPSEFRDHRCALCRRVMLSLDHGEHCATCSSALRVGHRAGQEAMRERAAAVCSARYVEHEKRLWNGPPAKRITDRVGGMADEAEQCAVAIRALEVEP